MKPIGRVLGLGSSHGDDRVGWEVVARLAASLPTGWDAHTIGHGAAVLDHLQGIERLVVCDAVRGSGRPGTISRWNWPLAARPAWRGCGSHDLDLFDVLQLAERLGTLPREVTIFAIEVAQVDAGAHLSAAVEAALPMAVQRICQALGELPCHA